MKPFYLSSFLFFSSHYTIAQTTCYHYPPEGYYSDLDLALRHAKEVTTLDLSSQGLSKVPSDINRLPNL
jgi:hypothetical protein